MDEIKVKSLLDLKTYFNISMLIQYRTRSVIFMVLYFVLIQFCVFYSSRFDWIEELEIAGIFLLFYGVLIPLLMYYAARRNMKKFISISEPKEYIFNTEKIQLNGETVNSSITWAHISKFIEREAYFVMMLSGRSFYYFPKSGFPSIDDTIRLKNIVKEKGIKMSYH